MSILWLTENYPPQRGGMAQSCDRIVGHLRSLGHSIHVLHFTGKGTGIHVTQQLNGWYATLQFDDSEAHTLNLAWEFIREREHSAMVCFGGYLPMLAAPVFSTWLSVPLLTMVRGNDFDSAIFTPRKRDMMRDALLASRIVTAVSKDKTDKIRKLYPAVNVHYVPNGIDTAQWKPSPSEVSFAEHWKRENCTDKICIGLFGQLKAKKGVHFLLDSLAYSDLNKRLHFLLIGEITDETQQWLTSHEFSYTSLSFLDRYELLKYYRCCDAVAIPSFYDGMPNVLLEAGALGVPVIAADVDGMKDVLRHKQSGLLFRPGDASSCRKAFYDFVTLSQADRDGLGAQLKQSIEAEYDVQLETKRYDQLFKTWLDSGHSGVRMHAQ
jgi:glycogen synthase